MIYNVAVGKQDDGAVGGEEDEDMPDSVEIGEANACPIGTEEPVIDPGNQGHGDDADAPLPKVDNPRVPLCLENHHHQANAGHSQQHQTESVHSLQRKCQSGVPNHLTPKGRMLERLGFLCRGRGSFSFRFG